VSCHTLVQEGGKASGQVRVSIAPNPSHLEFIGPVVLGMVRAEQTRLQDTAKQRVMGLLIHGDAAFAGLGVVAETLQLADTPGQPHAQPETIKNHFSQIDKQSTEFVKSSDNSCYLCVACVAAALLSVQNMSCLL